MLCDIIAKAVEKRPWRRHADAAAMRLLLEAFGRGEDAASFPE